MIAAVTGMPPVFGLLVAALLGGTLATAAMVMVAGRRRMKIEASESAAQELQSADPPAIPRCPRCRSVDVIRIAEFYGQPESGRFACQRCPHIFSGTKNHTWTHHPASWPCTPEMVERKPSEEPQAPPARVLPPRPLERPRI